MSCIIPSKILISKCMEDQSVYPSHYYGKKNATSFIFQQIASFISLSSYWRMGRVTQSTGTLQIVWWLWTHFWPATLYKLHIYSTPHCLSTTDALVSTISKALVTFLTSPQVSSGIFPPRHSDIASVTRCEWRSSEESLFIFMAIFS